MEQITQYINKFNVAVNDVEVVIQFIQQKPVFNDEGNVISIAENNVSDIVMPVSCANSLIQVLTSCISGHNEINAGAQDDEQK